MSRLKPVSLFARPSSSALPLPTYQLGSTWRRFCHSAPTTSAPAVVARLASSVSESSAVQPASSPVSTATRNAFSTGGARSISFALLMGGRSVARQGPAPVRRPPSRDRLIARRATRCRARSGTTSAGASRTPGCGGRPRRSRPRASARRRGRPTPRGSRSRRTPGAPGRTARGAPEPRRSGRRRTGRGPGSRSTRGGSRASTSRPIQATGPS